MPVDRCGAGAGAGGFSARLAGKRLAAAPAAAHAHRGLFWWTSQAVAFLARPDGATLGRLWAAQDRLDWAARRPVLGVHVRRGDTCLDGGRGELRKHKGRTCDGLAAYAARARAMVDAHGFRAVFLATDDPQIVAEAQRTNAFGVPVLAPGGVENASFSSPCVAAVGPNSVFTRRRRVPSTSRAQVANEDVDRHQLYGRGYYNKVLKDMPEADARADARAVLDDLFLLAACDGFVGKFTSNIDRLAVALSNAWRGGDCVTPFESLDAAWCADFGRRTGKSIHGDFMC